MKIDYARVSTKRGGSVCLNSSGRFSKWIPASIMPPPSSEPDEAHSARLTIPRQARPSTAR
ncbi:hypothetical protein FJU08_21280 [Martelella alba]|uniref:Uncharacterized protein n=1 Tax=Martelella alba TaxID=2590451 RepID=A0A506U0H0_9HYPH|nr:hypothetical protein FJU08_21280 [Martelella alba]